MTTTDYLINAGFIVMVCWQAREKRLDRRALVIPLVLLFFVAQQYLHTIPTNGNDLVLIGLLASTGLSLGLLSGFATHVRPGSDGFALARVGWVAGGLLVAGISSRVVFAFAVTHGAEPAIGSFSIAHQISASAWLWPWLDGDLRVTSACDMYLRALAVQRPPPRRPWQSVPRPDRPRGTGTPPGPNTGRRRSIVVSNECAWGVHNRDRRSHDLGRVSPRIAKAREHAAERVRRQRDTCVRWAGRWFWW